MNRTSSLRSNMPERHPKPMSTVPPSPACPTTRVVAAALDPQRRGHPGRHRRCVAEQRVEPGDLPRRLGVRGREHLEAAGGVDRHHLAAGGPHGGVEGVAGAQCLAAALAGPVARRQRVRRARRRTARCGRRGSPAGCRRRSSRPGRSGRPSLSRSPRRRRRGRAACSRPSGPERRRCGHALELALDEVRVEVEEGQAPELAPERRLEDASERGLGDRRDRRGRPPRWRPAPAAR